MGVMFFVIIGGYAYALYIGSLFIRNSVRNTIFNRVYTPGDILSCFYGVMFGMFSLGMGAPNMKAISEGRVAGKATFDVIDRKPKI